ncbi:MAG: hypothetical protein ACOYMR_00400 [Ilumatobacteraceae bacterium]
MNDADDELIRSLYRTDPEQFVAQRDATVKELKRAGQKDLAASLSKLRRPKVAEHAMNLLAASDPELVAEWADAVVAAEDEQAAVIGGAPATGLAPLLAAVRTASGRLVDAAAAGLPGGGAAHRAAIADALRAAASTAGAARVRAGLMGAPFEPSDEFFPGTEHVAVRPRTIHPPKPKPTRAAAVDRPIAEVVPLRSRKEDEAARRAAAKASAEEERRRRAEEAERRKALELAKAKVAAAKDRQAAAQRDLDAATDAVRQAEDALEELERALP